MQSIRSLMGALAIGAVVASTAGAQAINYTTQGFFSGP